MDDLCDPDLLDPDLDEPDFTEPDFTEPDFDEPDLEEPDFTEPDFVEPDFFEPDCLVTVPEDLPDFLLDRDCCLTPRDCFCDLFESVLPFIEELPEPDRLELPDLRV